MTRVHIVGARFLMVVLAGLAAMTGCGTDGPIEFQQTGGFINDETSVRIELDGKLTRATRSGEAVTATLEPATLEDLRSKIDSAEFDQLDDEYLGGNVADGYTYVITVRLDGDTFSVKTADGAPRPDRLTAVLDALVAINNMALGDAL